VTDDDSAQTTDNRQQTIDWLPPLTGCQYPLNFLFRTLATGF
jgi:hypothetical protein